MKYCIVTNEKKTTKNNYDTAGFYQWLNVFNSSLFSLEEFFEKINKHTYDIVHINLNYINATLFRTIREKLGVQSKTRIVAVVDIPVKQWKKEFKSYSIISNTLKEADFIFAADYIIASKLEGLIKKRVYEIAHPLDINKIKNIKKISKKNVITVLFHHGINNLNRLDKIIKKSFEYEGRILCYKINKKIINKLRKMKLDVIECDNEASLIHTLAESKFIIAPGEYENYNKIVQYSAVLGVPVIGTDSIEAQLRCYPFITNSSCKIFGYIKPVWWLMENNGGRQFMSQNAQAKAEYYNWENMRKKFMDFLYHQTGELKYKYNIIKPDIKLNITNFSKEIFHVYGDKNVKLTKKDFSVFCLIKDGIEYVKDYVKYYSSLGAKHLFFIDNGSTDGTITMLKKFDNVTIYKTELEHKKYECEIRRTIIEEHCMGSWCLYADADEIFDYPYSDKISMNQLIDYLNKNNFTSVIAYMLDMFPEQLNFCNMDFNESIINKYCYYDISQVNKKKYFSHSTGLCNYNILSDKSMKNYYGGIRDRYFKMDDVEYLLIKHPLMFLDGKLDVLTDPHYCNKSYVADINCILKHYKITNRFKLKSDKNKKNFAYFGMRQNEAYNNALKNKNEFKIITKTSRKFENINDLIKNKFIKVSRRFKEYAEKCSYVN